MKFAFLRNIKKAAVTGLLAGALLVVVPSLASAATVDTKPAPSDNFSLVDRDSMPKNLDRTVSSTSTDSTLGSFDCYWAQYPSDLYLDCLVFDGAIQVVLYCSDGNVYASPWYPGPARWLIHGSCGPNVLINAWGLNSI